MQKCIESKELEVHKLDPSFVLTDKLRALGTQDGINGLKVPRISGRLMTKNQFPHLFLSHWMLFPPTAFFRLVVLTSSLQAAPRKEKENYSMCRKKGRKKISMTNWKMNCFFLQVTVRRFSLALTLWYCRDHYVKVINSSALNGRKNRCSGLHLQISSKENAVHISNKLYQ